MISFNIKIADLVFKIETSYPDTKELCKDYLSFEDSDFYIGINEADINYEREKSYKEAIYEGRVPENYSNGYLESIAVYRKIAEIISNNNATVFHGALIELNGDGYLFTGRSGIGKTTHINNWLKMYPNVRILNGDKPILRIIDGKVKGYGTPWSGKENLNINNSVDVKAIIEITRDSSNHIEEVELEEALALLLSQTYRANTPNGIKDALTLAAKIGGSVKLYRLGCNMEIESAKVAYEGMNK